MHGQFIWYELTTPDVDAPKKFYPRFTGWGTQKFDDDYTMWTDGGIPIAGIFRLNDEMRQQGIPPNWMPYVESSDVDATVQKATSLGGKVMHGPADIPGTGRFAVIQDPQGAVIGVYKSATSRGGWDGIPVVGRFSWHELMTTDYARAYDFYKALFGWDVTGEMDMGGGSMYRMFGKGETGFGGIYNRMPDMAAVPPFWLVYIHVKDVAKAVAAATKAGATVVRPQMEIPGGGTIAILGDPQGAGFALHDLKALPKPKAEPKASAKKAAQPAAKKAAKPAAKKATKSKAVKKSATAKAKQAAKPAKKAATPTKKSTGKAKKKTAKKAGAAAKSIARRRSASKSRRPAKKKR
ncbi:MAG: VOC family protein [Gemmatimonadaceae bacterium]